MEKPLVLWVDELVASRSEEVPPSLAEQFRVTVIPANEDSRALAEYPDAVCIFFDFDYPDRRRLTRFANSKILLPSVPVVMVTLQHSESLAVWAYRHGALDYLVKPLQTEELGNCLRRVQSIIALRRSQSERRADLLSEPVPRDVALSSPGKHDRLLPAVYYVKRNFSERIYSDSMARLCNMSATHFSRAFKQTYGLTFQEFLLKYRVTQACKSLQTPAVSIADVGYSVGFSDPSYFARVFRRFVGIAPSEYASADSEERARIDESIGLEQDQASVSQTVRSLSSMFESG